MNDWTPINEKSPPLGECIICTVQDHIRGRLELRYPVYYIQMPYAEGYAFHFGEIGNILLPDVSEVLAWMPMPTVYQND
ncbi:hypothetical protein MKX47_21285 [Solibacillus sp. FSL R7-0668]|uniref:hypothetical protein n=1 Tax=Solibacillus sp. FSL R7-0668 TaxID=2921688 RepID=UPI0030F80EBF